MFLVPVLALLLALCVDSPAQTQTEMNMSAAADLKKADARLNAVYKKVLAANEDNEQFCSDLREAQRAWIKFVEFHLKTVFPLQEGEDPRVVYGSIYPMDFAGAKTELIEARTEQLQSLLDK
jgi:uncharacterized protein YecT (DUF1311 family)